MMWLSGWDWFKTKRSDEGAAADDPAGMGVEIGLDASLDTLHPPLFDIAVNRAQPSPAAVQPLGTDQRSPLAADR